jgi:ParB/RepB/Spo0J family partition protein
MEQITMLMPEQLHESPTNPRQHYDKDALTELAYSVAQQGIMQPIVVRRIETGKPHQFEVVFGHRRLRAAVLADLVTVPCIVREMTDEEAGIAQIHENLKRHDVHPIDEALGYVRLMSDHRLSVSDLCQKTGKTRAYIYARLKLSKLGQAAREACLQGHIGPEIGVLIARYCRSDKMQKRAIEMVTTQEVDDFGNTVLVPVPYRQAKTTLRGNFCIRLASAPFNLADATLRPAVGACTTCPKMAGNDGELADSTDADVCTDSGCYDSKVTLHTEAQVASARQRGLQVLDAEAAAKLIPYRHSSHAREHINVDEVAFERCEVDAEGNEVEGAQVTFAQALEALGAAAPKPVVVRHPHRPGVVLELLTEADAVTVLAQGHAGAPLASRWKHEFRDELAAARSAAGGPATDGPEGASSSPAVRAGAQGYAPAAPYVPQWQRDLDALPPLERAVRDHEQWHHVMRATMQRVRSTPRSTEDLRMLVRRELMLAGEWSDTVIDLMGWRAELPEDNQSDMEWCQAKLAGLGADDLAALLVLTAIENDGGHKEDRVGTAQRYGVDVLAVAGSALGDNEDGGHGEDTERDTQAADPVAAG